jgi:hypothetical protein
MYYQGLLNEMISWKKENALSLQPPCTPEELRALRRRTLAELGLEVPEAYCTFLIRMNGLDSNGLVIYASTTTPIVGFTDRFIEGFVEANLGWWDHAPNRPFLHFGESGDSKYVFSPSQSQYLVLDRQSDSVIKSVSTFEALLGLALEENRPNI